MNAALTLILGLLAIPALVFVNALFVAAEFSLVAVRRTKLQEMVEAGTRGAQAAQQATENLNSALAAAQLGITLASLALGWIGEPALASVIEPAFVIFPNAWQDIAAHSVAWVIALAFITFLHTVGGEQVPKVAALQIPDSMSLLLAKPLLVFERLTRPALVVMNGTSNWLLRLFRMKPQSLEQMVHSIDELGMLIEETRRAGVLSPDQARFVQNVFELTSKTVAEIMVPLEKMASLELHMPPERVLEAVRDGAHTRMPVYDTEPDRIVGIVNTKDLFHLFSLHGLVILEDAMYDAPFVGPHEPIATVLRLLRRLKRHMAVVRDEHGKVHGLLTLEDVLEQIVGEIQDEHDAGVPGA